MLEFGYLELAEVLIRRCLISYEKLICCTIFFITLLSNNNYTLKQSCTLLDTIQSPFRHRKNFLLALGGKATASRNT